MFAVATYKHKETCSCHKGLIVHAKMDNFDPTRTTMLRKAFAAELNRKFSKLSREIRHLIDEQDFFGLKYTQGNKGLKIHSYPFVTSGAKVDEFMAWLQNQVDNDLLKIRHLPQYGTGVQQGWTDMYIEDSYKRGVQRARYEIGKTGMAVPSIEESGGVSISMGTPFHMDRVGLLYTRTYNELKGVTDTMAKQMSSVLATAMVDGDGPALIARKLTSGIIDGTMDMTDSLGRFIPAKRRATIIARTEMIRAHHHANIQEYRNWGVAGVKVRAEFRTAGDERVCDQCQQLHTNVYSLDEIEGMIPVHPQCRCMALPVNPETVTAENEYLLKKEVGDIPPVRLPSEQPFFQYKGKVPIRDLSLDITQKNKIPGGVEAAQKYWVDRYKHSGGVSRSDMSNLFTKKHGGIPDIPVSKPDIPVSKPDIPVSKPDIPVSKPDIPVSKPKKWQDITKAEDNIVRANDVPALKDLNITTIVDTGGGFTEAQFVKIANNAARVIQDDIYGNFPELKKLMKGTRLRLVVDKTNTTGAMNYSGWLDLPQIKMGKDGLKLSPKWGQPRVGAWTIDTSSFNAALSHEFGHHVWHTGMKLEKAEFNQIYRALGGDTDPVKFGKLISKYGASNNKEAFAEVFSLYTHPNYVKGTLPKEMEAFMEKVIGKRLVSQADRAAAAAKKAQDISDAMNKALLEKLAAEKTAKEAAEKAAAKAAKEAAEAAAKYPADLDTAIKKLTDPDVIKNIIKAYDPKNPFNDLDDALVYLYGSKENAVKVLKEMTDNSDVFMAIKDNILIDKIIKGDKRFKNSLETGKGTFKTIGEARSIKERAIFGITEGLEDYDSWPKYGFISNKNSMDYESIVNWGYGDTYVMFKKKDILKRTTMTMGDSYDGNMFLPSGLPGKVAPPTKLVDPSTDFFAPVVRDGKGNLWNVKRKDIRSLNDLGKSTGTYIEAQIYGDLTLDNVDTVFMASKSKAQKLRKILDKEGYSHIKIQPCKYDARVKQLWEGLDSYTGPDYKAWHTLRPEHLDKFSAVWIEKAAEYQLKAFKSSLISFMKNNKQWFDKFPQKYKDWVDLYQTTTLTTNQKRQFLKEYFEDFHKRENGIFKDFPHMWKGVPTKPADWLDDVYDQSVFQTGWTK